MQKTQKLDPRAWFPLFKIQASEKNFTINFPKKNLNSSKIELKLLEELSVGYKWKENPNNRS